jgi:glycosyltransferase involved in cell wall biosynthesis/mannose-6-phosphate isomerase-like protein (cupin superfamily)
MKVALLSPIAWRTPPQHYGPWEQIVSILSEGLVRRGIDVTLFATGDSITNARLKAIVPRGYEEDRELDPKVCECLHISNIFELANEYDIIHNHFDFLPLTYTDLVTTPVLTTIHGFSSPKILPVYKKYNSKVYYVSISDADRSRELNYVATVHHGIEVKRFSFREQPGEYLLFFGRIHHEKGTYEAIQVAKRFGMNLIIAGIVQDRDYFETKVVPHIDDSTIRYIGPVYTEKKNELLKNAYALIHMINFDEPFGLSLIEAMACGTPAVAIPRGAIPEIIDDLKTGFFVKDIEEAITALSKIPELKRKDCRRAVEERFGVVNMVDKYVEVYRQILQIPRPDARKACPPWGKWEVLLDEPNYKVKRITVLPGKRLSYQKHFKRKEHWMVVEGKAVVTLDDKEIRLKKGETVDIPQEAAHRIANREKKQMTFIEIQQGEYFGEDDIVRLEDDYGRARKD